MPKPPNNQGGESPSSSSLSIYMLVALPRLILPSSLFPDLLSVCCFIFFPSSLTPSLFSRNPLSFFPSSFPSLWGLIFDSQRPSFGNLHYLIPIPYNSGVSRAFDCFSFTGPSITTSNIAVSRLSLPTFRLLPIKNGICVTERAATLQSTDHLSESEPGLSPS